jgi:hypothetical protein
MKNILVLVRHQFRRPRAVAFRDEREWIGVQLRI